MTLQHINLENLTISPLNVRKYGTKDVADLITSLRAHGLLQPLLVRPVGEGFEVIAGQRRLNALRQLAEEGEVDPIPCLVMAESDDAAAIEASLAENIDRLPMDEVDQYRAFAKLVNEGRDVAEIATAFGITDRMVTQRLALGNLHGPILTAYRKGDVHPRDVRILTMATPKQQKAWWALVKDDEACVPSGQRLKDWLFGGAHIPTSNALFDVDASGLAVIADLFGEESYFAESEAFWACQNAALAERMAALLDAGWADVIALDVGAYFASWDYRCMSKEDGGKVFITTSTDGEITVHEGYITDAEAKRRVKEASGSAAVPKPELTKPAQNYMELHRHAAVRADLLHDSATALRLIAAQLICGSDLWRVDVDPQKAAKPEIADSLETNTGQQAMQDEREAVQALLAIDESDYIYRPSITQVFDVLQSLDATDVTRVLTFLMAETLSVQSPLIETLGETMGTDMRQHWSPDQVFFDLIRDRAVLNTMVGEYAGDEAAKANLTATAKSQRAILTACCEGNREPTNRDWLPRYMTFPQGSYRGQESNIAPPHPEEDQREAA